ncbi:hypothetical protein Bbelb_399950 [Branchiostoma belcheri]|nr:hypothetical protein Bbelb_399950 [Branchiostoma belcheri]
MRQGHGRGRASPPLAGPRRHSAEIRWEGGISKQDELHRLWRDHVGIRPRRWEGGTSKQTRWKECELPESRFGWFHMNKAFEPPPQSSPVGCDSRMFQNVYGRVDRGWLVFGTKIISDWVETWFQLIDGVVTGMSWVVGCGRQECEQCDHAEWVKSDGAEIGFQLIDRVVTLFALSGRMRYEVARNVYCVIVMVDARVSGSSYPAHATRPAYTSARAQPSQLRPISTKGTPEITWSKLAGGTFRN